MKSSARIKRKTCVTSDEMLKRLFVLGAMRWCRTYGGLATIASQVRCGGSNTKSQISTCSKSSAVNSLSAAWCKALGSISAA